MGHAASPSPFGVLGHSSFPFTPGKEFWDLPWELRSDAHTLKVRDEFGKEAVYVLVRPEEAVQTWQIVAFAPETIGRMTFDVAKAEAARRGEEWLDSATFLRIVADPTAFEPVVQDVNNYTVVQQPQPAQQPAPTQYNFTVDANMALLGLAGVAALLWLLGQQKPSSS